MMSAALCLLHVFLKKQLFGVVHLGHLCLFLLFCIRKSWCSTVLSSLKIQFLELRGHPCIAQEKTCMPGTYLLDGLGAVGVPRGGYCGNSVIVQLLSVINFPVRLLQLRFTANRKRCLEKWSKTNPSGNIMASTQTKFGTMSNCSLATVED